MTANDINLVLFLSDGRSFSGNRNSEVNELGNEFGADITAIAIAIGSGAVLTQLEPLDNTGGAPQSQTSPNWKI